MPASLRAKVARRIQIFRFHIRRRLPLQVGDKLANRHGHKGVVGRILPDAHTPRCSGASPPRP